jgi:hypothetical protein
MKPRSLLSVLVAASAFTFAGRVAAADRAPQTSGLMGEAERWLRAATAGPTVASDPTTHGVAAERSTTAEWHVAGNGPDEAAVEGKPFFDLALPNASIVARDWRGSMKIVGDRTLLVDDLRPTASNRMVVGRLATDARLTTFVQAGVGEWRIDTAMFPNARSYSEVAGQVGGGFELRLSPRCRVAGEAQYTALYRDLHYSSDEVAPRILAFVVAVDGRF